MKKYLFIGLGSLTFIIGTAGIFLPVLPTTGFYLLTGFFWMRSSPKLYHRLTGLNAYQKYVTPFLEKKMTRKAKQRMFLMMGVVFLLSGILVHSTFVRWLLAIIYFSLVSGLSLYLRGAKMEERIPEKETLR
ncbi:YbaN family protein [Enterococcus sp. JM9B]|uniref:YbaN family protein n=1 Tax=Enterococcus sp. JM9B TaxID=1857216 RepID=UPI001374A00D|nr:YbaN family protein [Enterococcus sp. JM9B]KAF1301799.1 hypothetical protein BAU16_07880 [Enterococcus sp. JM9B]